jgi:hypothetical protein
MVIKLFLALLIAPFPPAGWTVSAAWSVQESIGQHGKSLFATLAGRVGVPPGQRPQWVESRH